MRVLWLCVHCQLLYCLFLFCCCVRKELWQYNVLINKCNHPAFWFMTYLHAKYWTDCWKSSKGNSSNLLYLKDTSVIRTRTRIVHFNLKRHANRLKSWLNINIYQFSFSSSFAHWCPCQRQTKKFSFGSPHYHRSSCWIANIKSGKCC